MAINTAPDANLDDDLDFGLVAPEVTTTVGLKNLPPVPAGSTPIARFNVGGTWQDAPLATVNGKSSVTVKGLDGQEATIQMGYKDATGNISWLPSAVLKKKIAGTKAQQPVAAPNPGHTTQPGQPQGTPNVIASQPHNVVPLGRNAPAPVDELAKRTRTPIIALLDSVRSPERNNTLDAALDLLEQALVEYSVDHNIPPHQRTFSAAVAKQISLIIEHDPETPARLKKLLKSPAVNSVQDLQKRLLSAKKEHRKKVLMFLKADPTAQKFFNIPKTGKLDVEHPFRGNLEYDSLFDDVCSRQDFGKLSPVLSRLVGAVSEMPPRSDVLATERTHLAQRVMQHNNPEKMSRIKKYLPKVLNGAVNTFGYAALISAFVGGGLPAFLLGAKVILGKNAAQMASGVTIKDVTTAATEGRLTELAKLFGTNNIVSRRFNEEATIGGDLADALTNCVKDASIVHSPGTLEETNDIAQAEALIAEASKKAAA